MAGGQSASASRRRRGVWGGAISRGPRVRRSLRRVAGAAEPACAPAYVVQRPCRSPRRRTCFPSSRSGLCGAAVGETLEKPWRRASVSGEVGRDSGWTIRLCGPVGVDLAGGSHPAALPGRQGRMLFAYLVLNRDRDCARAELIDALWPENPPAAAETALSALLSKLRRALGEGAISGRSGLRLTPPEDVEVDAEQAAAAADAAEAAIDALDWDGAITRARAALAVDLQTFLPDCEGHWVNERRRELEAVRLRALEALALASLRRGELGAAEQAARAAISTAPFRESAHRLLMEAHEAAGNPAEALRAFEELRTLLRDELGTAPGQAALAVHERLLRGEAPAPAPAPRAGRDGDHRLAAAAGGRARPPGARGAHARARVPRRALARGRRRHAPARAARRRRRHRQDAAVRRAGAARPRRRRDRDVRPLRRGGDRALPAGGRDGAGLVVRCVAGAAARAARPARRRAGDPAAGARAGPGRDGGRAAPERPGRAPPAVLRRGRRAVRRRGGAGAARARLRRPPLGRPPDAAAPALPRAGAAAAPGAADRHVPRRRARAGPSAERADHRRAPRGAARAARAHGPGRGRGRRAGRLALARRARAGVRARPARRDRGQPVLHRGGRAPPARHRARARRHAVADRRRRARTACARSPRGACAGSAPSRAARCRSPP